MYISCVNIYIDIDTRVRCFATINIKRDDTNGESRGITLRRAQIKTSFTEISLESARVVRGSQVSSVGALSR